jgi:RNA polymerase sigma-70 factor (ECF subfamily)
LRNRLPELLIKAMVIFGYKLLVLTIYQSYSDEVLLDLIKAEDEAAFRCLYERYWARLLGQAFATLKNREDAEELVQTVFLNLWKRRQSLHIQSSLATYLASACKYEVLACRARRKAEDEKKSAYLQGVSEEDDSTAAWLDAEALRRDIEKTVQQLPEKCRLVFRMSREQGLTGTQIASDLEIAPKTVEAHMGKALKHIRSSLRNFLFFF